MQTLSFPAVFALLAVMAQPSVAADLNFCWVGGGGYTLTGTMKIPDSKMTKTLITEDDVAAFEIIGYLNGKRIGSWNIDARTADQTWHLRFDPVSMTFLTGGWFASTNSQGWNADGSVDNCGAPGFGFNSGSYAQDICLNGAYIRGSSIPPETPIFATTAKVMPDCNQTIPMGKRHKTNRMLDGESVLP